MIAHPLPARDRELIQIVDAALADSVRRSGKWLACRPGCSKCCVGVFAINQLDALRLRHGLAEIEKQDPERAQRVRSRAMETVARLTPDYPGDPATGLLSEAETDEDCKRWDDFANDVPCPVLDPGSGTCDLYEFRPVVCRTFGPPLMSEEGELGVCDLCFEGASEAEIKPCEIKPDSGKLEPVLLEDLEKTTGAGGETIIAFALVRDTAGAKTAPPANS